MGQPAAVPFFEMFPSLSGNGLINDICKDALVIDASVEMCIRDSTRADHMGMMATVMNSLAVADVLEPVSYTHLDVYKRQTYSCAKRLPLRHWFKYIQKYPNDVTGQCSK